jgi:hypothetical protein
MLNWLMNNWHKKKNKNRADKLCKDCVWYGSEEENNVPFKKGVRYCDQFKDYRYENESCPLFKQEYFEATESSISTEEISINHDLNVRKED